MQKFLIKLLIGTLLLQQVLSSKDKFNNAFGLVQVSDKSTRNDELTRATEERDKNPKKPTRKCIKNGGACNVNINALWDTNSGGNRGKPRTCCNGSFCSLIGSNAGRCQPYNIYFTP